MYAYLVSSFSSLSERLKLFNVGIVDTYVQVRSKSSNVLNYTVVKSARTWSVEITGDM